MKIKVTKDILEKSMWCGNSKMNPESVDNVDSNCAVALAVRDIFPHASVGEDTIYPFGIPFGRVNPIFDSIELPQNARDFIESFDNFGDCGNYIRRAKMSELEFEVEISDSTIERINIDEVKEILKTSTTLAVKWEPEDEEEDDPELILEPTAISY